MSSDPLVVDIGVGYRSAVMSNLSGTIEQLMTPNLFDRVSVQSGLPTAKVRTGMTGAVASILDGLINRAEDPRSMGRIVALVHSAPAADLPERMLDDDVTMQRHTHQLLGIASGDSRSLTTRIARYAGIGAGAAAGIVTAAVAVVIGGFRKLEQARGDLDASSLASTLRDERARIQASLPATMLDGEPVRAADSTIRIGAPESRAAPVFEPVRVRPWWLIALLGIVVLLFLLWLIGRTRYMPRSAAPPPTGDRAPR
jgi:hypothetical protein